MVDITSSARPSYVRPHIHKMRSLMPPVSDEPAISDPVRLGHNENNFGCCIGGAPAMASLRDDSCVVSKSGSTGVTTSIARSVNDLEPTNNNTKPEFLGAKDGPSTPYPSEFSVARFAQDILWLQRYSGSNQTSLKRDFALWRGLPNEDYVCLGLGALDLADSIMRATCEPNVDSILVTPPTFFAYADRALINNVSVIEVPLEFCNNDFILRTEKIKHTLTSNPNIKLVMLASPGNPSGSLIPISDVCELLEFASPHTIVVIDEAYIDYATNPAASTVLPLVTQYPNLVVLNTLSKAQGLAGLRLGAAYAQPALIEQLSKVQLPHLVPSPVGFLGHLALSAEGQATAQSLIAHTLDARRSLIHTLSSRTFRNLGVGDILGGSQGNFVLFPVLPRDWAPNGNNVNARAKLIVSKLRSDHDIEIRFLGTLAGVEGCLRITVGTQTQQKQFAEALQSVMRQC